ncbi:MAG: N-acyl-D-amino-acid deacylase family protein [Gemmatimonadota bacterium]
MNPRRIAAALLAAATITLAPLRSQGQEQVDILIQGGTVVDGTGAVPRRADVAIRAGRIVFVGSATRRFQPTRTIDAAGLLVAPGFIDPHTHAAGDLDSDDRNRRRNAPWLMQGVTTVITGNDGGGPVDVAGQFERWRQNGIGTNAATYVGFGSVRSRVLGPSSSAATPAQLEAMKALVAKGMTDGALGLSTGLYYAPQFYSSTEEVIALARVAGEHGGIYDSHLRDESSYSIGLLGAIREAIRIGEEGRLPVHIAHIKALGTDVWGRSDSAITIIRSARARGTRVTADQYPYTASGSSVSASLLPRWAEAGGRDSLRARLADPATRSRLLTDMTDNLRRRGGPASLLMTSSSQREIVGKTLAQLAESRGKDPIATAVEIILAGGSSVASFNMQEPDIVALMREPFVFTGSDGSDGHPRKYGSYPKKIREYVFGKRVLTIGEMVQKSSSSVAEALGIAERGLLREGYQADVIVFDSASTRDLSTYEQPEVLAAGMRHVIVSGQMAVSDGKLTGVLAGQGIRRASRR